MNQRAHIRRNVDMPARLSVGDFRDRPCQVRDFCLGGMLVSMAVEEKTLLSTLQKGDALTISVDVQGLRGVRSVTLRAMLARKSGAELGLAFDAPDSTSLLAVQNHVRALLDSEPSVPGRPQSLNSDQARLAALDLLDLTRRFCLSRLEVFFPAADQALRATAARAVTLDEQQPWIDASKLLHQNTAALSRNFVARSTQTIEQLSHGLGGLHSGAQGSGQSDTQSGKLSLVDKDVFEDWLTLKVMASRAESHVNEELLHLQLRFDELFSISLSARKNPLHPSVFCNAFCESLRLLPLKQKTDRIILTVFDETVVHHLREFYLECNAVLARDGVLPDIDVGRYISERYGHKNASSVTDKPTGDGTQKIPAEEVARAAERNVAEPADVGKVAEPSSSDASEPVRTTTATSASSLAARQFALQQHIAKHAYETVKKLLSSHSVEVARDRSANRGHVADSSPVAEEKLDSALNLLQRSVATDNALHIPLPQRVQSAVQGGESNVHLDHDTQAAVDVIHNLFGGILANPALSERVRDAIRKLEVPFLRLLLNDDSFLEEESHPARQMLNRIAHLGVRGSANLQAHENEIDQEVQGILSGFEDDVGVFRNALQKLDRLAERQQSLYLRNMKRVTESCDGRYKVVLARKEVNHVLERRIGGRAVPKAVLSLIDAGWRQLLVQTLLRGGRDSREWHEFLGVVDRMILSVEQIPTQEELTAILASIKSGLGQVDHTQMQNARLISELRDLLSRKARAQQAPDMITVPAGLVEDSTASTADSPGEIEQRWTRRAQRHEVGDWFSFFDNGQDQMVRLAWADAEKQTFVFVNHQGMKVTEYALTEFSERLISGQMQQIDNLDAPAVDRGLESMVQRIYDQMAHQATHDDLCELINRREFERRLRQRLAAGNQHGTLLHVDIDQFKVVNNLGGPQAGDELLVAFSLLLKAQFPGSLIARLGGDEFAIWLEDLPAEAALRAAEQFCRRIPGERFVCAGKPFFISISSGLVQRESASATAAELMRAADSACHAAKEAGRNRLQRYAADDKDMVKRDDIMAWVARLNEAIENNQLLLRCQRIESASDRTALPAYEVLISISGDDGELIAPSEFMHVAKRYNRMHAVDRWVVSNVLRWMHANPACVSELDHLSINLSGHSLNDATLLEFMLEMFELYPVPRERICFEVTETAAIANLDDAADFIREMQDFGCRFSLDDFGSGLASYGHLKHLPVDYIKIDGSFIRDVADDPADLAMVRSINEMGHLMGKRTIAEYVENDRIRELMAEIGVDYVQGYGIEKPRPLSTLGAAS
jgi:diguanylate cyclase (GGDEF)-like protein